MVTERKSKGWNAGRKTNKKAPKDPEVVAAALDAIDLEKYRGLYVPQGVPVDALFANFRDVCLNGTGTVPECNPYNYRNFGLAFHKWLGIEAVRRASPVGKGPAYRWPWMKD